jgi:hypothetical protein
VLFFVFFLPFFFLYSYGPDRYVCFYRVEQRTMRRHDEGTSHLFDRGWPSVNGRGYFGQCTVHCGCDPQCHEIEGNTFEEKCGQEATVCVCIKILKHTCAGRLVPGYVVSRSRSRYSMTRSSCNFFFHHIINFKY